MNYLAISSYHDYIISDVFLEIDSEVYEQSLREETAQLLEEHPEQVSRFLFEGSAHTTLIFDSTNMGSTHPLEAVAGQYDVISIDGLTVSEWLSHRVNDASQFRSVVE